MAEDSWTSYYFVVWFHYSWERSCTTCIRKLGRLLLIVSIRYLPTNRVGEPARSILSYLRFFRLGRTSLTPPLREVDLFRRSKSLRRWRRLSRLSYAAGRAHER
jgi:hypothetical protein